MSGRARPGSLVGRDALLRRLKDVVTAALEGERVTVLVSGEAGIGKTSLVASVVSAAAEQGARIGWGTCVDAEGPAYWPWTQLLAALVRGIGADHARGLAGDDARLLANLVPALGPPSSGEATERDLLLLLDAATSFVGALARDRGLVVVLDDLQWADASSLALFDYMARSREPSPVCLIATYRHDELDDAASGRLHALLTSSHHVRVPGIDAAAVHELIGALVDAPVDPSTSEVIHRRTGGHPFFVREVALAGALDGQDLVRAPAAVRGLIEKRLARLSDSTRELLTGAAVLGGGPIATLAAAMGMTPAASTAAAGEAADAGVVTLTGDQLSFTHDLLRETVLGGVDPMRRVALHRAIAAALEGRVRRGEHVAPAELARHFVGAVSLDGPDRAVRWALEAAAADSAALAFGEAAAHLRRLRTSLADAGVALDDERLFDVLLCEADALTRAGSTSDARTVLVAARAIAERSADPKMTARVALAGAALGARFSTRRDSIVRELESALASVAGADPLWEAQLAAALARELQHSVADDRPRAGSLSERALALGRSSGEPAVLAACLLARHDVLWTPGTERARVEIAREIVAVAAAAGDDERQAQGLLLLANALLEAGSAAYDAALDSCLAVLDRLGEPRHRYQAETRRACRALLRGELDEAAERIERAAALGHRIREPDTENVRMSQRLELVRARGNPKELEAFAAEAIAHWIGAPVHAHGVAAGFAARAGDVDTARRHLATVVDLGTWRADRSYLWSVFVREIAHAAVELDDRAVCVDLLDDLGPVVGSCGVNGAMVAFAGSHGHVAGLLAGALGDDDTSRRLLGAAADTYARIGAPGWQADVRRLMASRTRAATSRRSNVLRRRGAVWDVTFDGRQATVPHTKGLADIARLVAAPNVEIHAVELMGGTDSSAGHDALADREALEAYRSRLEAIDVDTEEAFRNNNPERVARLHLEREALLDELGRVSGLRGRGRSFANHPGERARKAVAARVRDTIRKLEPLLPELAAHLDRTIVTGTFCRYRADDVQAWTVVTDARGTIDSDP